MSNKSKKSGRPTVKRDPASYLPALETYRRLLQSAARSWDETAGDEHVVAMLLALRVLLVDGLINRVLSVKRMIFIDTAFLPEGHDDGTLSGAV